MTEEQEARNTPTHKTGNKPTFLQIVLSTCAAAFGVQSNKNRERDFNSGNIYTYIAAGVIFTAIFVTVIIVVVKLVLRSSGI